MDLWCVLNIIAGFIVGFVVALVIVIIDDAREVSKISKSRPDSSSEEDESQPSHKKIR